jgi:restriction system protein
LDLANINAPLQEINDLPLARFDLRFEIHPRKFEELVASVFQQIGYDAAATAYHADGGIDVVLHGDGVGTAGVQVKRYRDRIEAEQIRAFAGALVLGGYTRDVFVTTSSFRSGAVASAQRFAGRGVPIELLDADKFYDALKMARRPPYEDFEDWYAEISDVEDSVIYDGEGPF